ncbi:hypothetical protein LQW54_011865 [Pestalotiopsis sp. IQ-011]
MDLTMTAGPYSEPEPDLPSYMWRPSRIPAARIVSPEALVDFIDSLLEFGLDEVLEAFSLRLANTHGYMRRAEERQLDTSQDGMQVGKFMVNKELRKHLGVQLSHHKNDCGMTELRTSYPANTLQITRKLKNQEANMATWAENRAVAEKTIAAFDQGHLRLLLGSFYDDIITMRKLSSSHEGYRAAGPPKHAPDHGKTPAGTDYRGASAPYGGNSVYSRALSYTQHNPSVGATPTMSYPGHPPAVPLGPSSRGNIGPPVVTAPKPPMRPTDLPAANLYPVYTQTATRPPQPPLAPQRRAPLAEVSGNVDEWEKVARLQDEIAIAGGTTPPSKKRNASALALGNENATVAQDNRPPSAGAKRRATEFIDLTSDGD